MCSITCSKNTTLRSKTVPLTSLTHREGPRAPLSVITSPAMCLYCRTKAPIITVKDILRQMKFVLLSQQPQTHVCWLGRFSYSAVHTLHKGHSEPLSSEKVICSGRTESFGGHLHLDCFNVETSLFVASCGSWLREYAGWQNFTTERQTTPSRVLGVQRWSVGVLRNEKWLDRSPAGPIISQEDLP